MNEHKQKYPPLFANRVVYVNNYLKRLANQEATVDYRYDLNYIKCELTDMPIVHVKCDDSKKGLYGNRYLQMPHYFSIGDEVLLDITSRLKKCISRSKYYIQCKNGPHEFLVTLAEQELAKVLELKKEGYTTIKIGRSQFWNKNYPADIHGLEKDYLITDCQLNALDFLTLPTEYYLDKTFFLGLNAEKSDVDDKWYELGNEDLKPHINWEGLTKENKDKANLYTIKIAYPGRPIFGYIGSEPGGKQRRHDQSTYAGSNDTVSRVCKSYPELCTFKKIHFGDKYRGKDGIRALEKAAIAKNREYAYLINQAIV